MIPTSMVTYCWTKSGLLDSSITESPVELSKDDDVVPVDVLEDADRLVREDDGDSDDDVILLEPSNAEEPEIQLQPDCHKESQLLRKRIGALSPTKKLVQPKITNFFKKF